MLKLKIEVHYHKNNTLLTYCCRIRTEISTVVRLIGKSAHLTRENHILGSSGKEKKNKFLFVYSVDMCF